MVAWFLIEQDKLNLNKELCFMYAMAHDLVEVYAGDTFIYDKKKKSSKNTREEEAFKKIIKRFSHFKNLVKVLEKYEKKTDEESNFIYILDKLLPPIQIYLENGKMWHKKKVSLLKALESKNEIISLSSYFNKYWQELKQELIKNKKKLFPK